MRLVGYCERCRRVRSVRVSAAGLAMMQATGGFATGICAECEHREDERRKESDRRHRGRG